MKTRIITSIVAIIFMCCVLALFNTVVFDIVICLICLLGIHEIYKAFDLKAPYIFAGFVPYVFIVMLTRYGFASKALLPISYVLALYLAVCVIFNSQKIDFAKLGGMVTYSAIVTLCFYSFIYLKRLLPHVRYNYDAIYFIVLICAFAWGGDSMAYFVGRACGKHKMAPHVSPHKTWEGAVGGVIGSMLLGVIVTVIYGAMHGLVVGIKLESLGWKYYLFIALLGGVASILGIFGDLFASAIKRQQGIKDYGTIFPGHGGVMDRFDSVTFIAPLVCIGVTFVFYYFKA